VEKSRRMKNFPRSLLILFHPPTVHVQTTQRKILKACRTLFIAAYGAGLIYR
jgi:hypothetical protein